MTITVDQPTGTFSLVIEDQDGVTTSVVGNYTATKLDPNPEPIPPEPEPKPTRARLGIAASSSKAPEKKPTWDDARKYLEEQGANVYTRRIYLQPEDRLGPSVRDLIAEMNAQDIYCIVSMKNTTSSHFADLKKDLAQCNSEEHYMAMIDLHEPAGDVGPSKYVDLNNANMDCIEPYNSFIKPALCANGYWYSELHNKRNDMMAQGGFDAWFTAQLLERLEQMEGYFMIDPYDGGKWDPNKPRMGAAESPGKRIDNMAAWASGEGFAETNPAGFVSGALHPVTRLGTGEMSTFDEANYIDMLRAFYEHCVLGADWNHWADHGELNEKSKEETINGVSGGNRNAAKLLAEYKRQTGKDAGEVWQYREVSP